MVLWRNLLYSICDLSPLDCRFIFQIYRVSSLYQIHCETDIQYIFSSIYFILRPFIIIVQKEWIVISRATCFSIPRLQPIKMNL